MSSMASQETAVLSYEEANAARERIYELCRGALPNPADRTIYNRTMFEANLLGLNWLDSLAYVAERQFVAYRQQP